MLHLDDSHSLAVAGKKAGKRLNTWHLGVNVQKSELNIKLHILWVNLIEKEKLRQN